MTQSSLKDPDVFIAGAGPAGMTVATELVRAGVRCRIIDKASGPKTYSQAGVIWPRTQEALEFMGILDKWKPLSVPWHGLVVMGGGKYIGELSLFGMDSPNALPLLVGQNVTERLFDENLASVGCPVERNVELIKVLQDSECVTVTLRHADGRIETAQSQYIVGCEGTKSIVRQSAGLEYDTGRYEGTEFIQADCHIRSSLALKPGYCYAFATPLAMCFLSPMSVDGIYRVALFHKDPDPTVKGDPPLEEIQDLVRRVAIPDAELSNPTWLNRYRTSHHNSTSYRSGRLFVAGDAAHTWVAIGGQGMNTGIQDGFNLAWKLAHVIQGKAKPELLDSYTAERAPIAAMEVKQTTMEYNSLANPSKLLTAAAAIFIPLLLKSDTFQGKVRNNFSELYIAYPNSPIVEDHGGSNGPKAGDRAPDTYITQFFSKETIRLFDLFRSGTWTLLLFSGYSPSTQSYQKLAQTGQTIQSKYGDRITFHLVVADKSPPHISSVNWDGSILMDCVYFAHQKYDIELPCLYLVRPDGYIGFRSHATDGDKLLTYLNRIFTQ